MEDSYYESRDSSTWLEGLLYPCSDLVFLNGLVSKPRLSTGLKLQQPSGTMERAMKVLWRATDFFNLGQTATLVPHPIWPKAGKQGVCFHLCITRCNSDLKKKKKKVCIWIHLEIREQLCGTDSLFLGIPRIKCVSLGVHSGRLYRLTLLCSPQLTLKRTKEFQNFNNLNIHSILHIVFNSLHERY